MALDRQKEAADKRSTHQQQQQKQAEGLLPRMKVIMGGGGGGGILFRQKFRQFRNWHKQYGNFCKCFLPEIRKLLNFRKANQSNENFGNSPEYISKIFGIPSSVAMLYSFPEISENSMQCIVKSLGRRDYFLGWLSLFFAGGGNGGG